MTVPRKRTTAELAAPYFHKENIMAKKKTILPPTEAAIVTTGNMTDIELLLPEGLKDEDHPTNVFIFLVACFLRSKDEKFCREVVDWFGEQMEQMDKEEAE